MVVDFNYALSLINRSLVHSRALRYQKREPR